MNTFKTNQPITVRKQIKQFEQDDEKTFKIWERLNWTWKLRTS